MKWFWVCAALATGCGSTMSVDAGCPHSLDLGSSDGPTFVALADGAPLDMHAGPQGGYHAFASVRATGLAPRGLVEIELVSAQGRLTSVRRLDLTTVRLDPIECGWQRVGDALFFEQNDVGPYRGLTATLTLVLSGSDADQVLERAVVLQ